MTREEADKKVEKHLHRRYWSLFFDDNDTLMDYGESDACKELFWKGYQLGIKEQKEKQKEKDAKEACKVRNLLLQSERYGYKCATKEAWEWITTHITAQELIKDFEKAMKLLPKLSDYSIRG